MVQFSSVRSLSHLWLFVTPWTVAHQAFLSITDSRSLPKLMSIESVMPSNHLTLCHPLLPPSIFPNIRVFSNESALRITDGTGQETYILKVWGRAQGIWWTAYIFFFFFDVSVFILRFPWGLYSVALRVSHIGNPCSWKMSSVGHVLLPACCLPLGWHELPPASKAFKSAKVETRRESAHSFQPLSDHCAPVFPAHPTPTPPGIFIHRWCPCLRGCQKEISRSLSDSNVSKVAILMCVRAQLCPTLCDPMDCSPPRSSVHGISQARILEWVAIPLSRRNSWPKDQTCIFCIGRWILYCWATWEGPKW